MGPPGSRRRAPVSGYYKQKKKKKKEKKLKPFKKSIFHEKTQNTVI